MQLKQHQIQSNMKTKFLLGIMAITAILFTSCNKNNEPIKAGDNEVVINNVVYKLHSEVSIDHNEVGPRYYPYCYEQVAEDQKKHFELAGDFERYSIGVTIDLSSFASDDGYSFGITTPSISITQSSFEEQRFAYVNDEFSTTPAFNSGTKMVITHEGDDSPFILTIDGVLINGETISLRMYVPADQIDNIYYDE